MLAKQANKIIAPWKEGVWEIWKQREEKQFSFPAMINSEQRLSRMTFFLNSVIYIIACYSHLTGEIMMVGKVEAFHLKNKQMCMCSLRAEVKTFCSIFQLILSHWHQCTETCVSSIVSFGVWDGCPNLTLLFPHLQLFTQAGLPPAPNTCRTCKLCCIHLAQTALIWTLSMSAPERNVLVLALVKY